jgi:hypothetical protein
MEFPRCDLYPAEKGFYCQCVGCSIISNDTAGCVLTERSDGIYFFKGKTPHGGTVAELHFTNDEGKKVSKPAATHVEIKEFDKAGTLLYVEYGIIDPYGFYMNR